MTQGDVRSRRRPAGNYLVLSKHHRNRKDGYNEKIIKTRPENAILTSECVLHALFQHLSEILHLQITAHDNAKLYPCTPTQTDLHKINHPHAHASFQIFHLRSILRANSARHVVILNAVMKIIMLTVKNLEIFFS
jgi:hypothetical protein